MATPDRFAQRLINDEATRAARNKIGTDLWPVVMFLAARAYQFGRRDEAARVVDRLKQLLSDGER
jgi:hypothetical protein